MKQIGSEITGALSRVQGASSSTGQQHGGTGVVSVEATRAWLVGRDPAEVDKALQTSLLSSLGVDSRMKHEWRFPPDAPAYKVAVGVEIDAERVKLPMAREKILAAMTPPTHEQAEQWLAMLQVATAGGRKSEEGAMLTLALYAGALTKFPADVAMKACENLALRVRWFPTLGDIVAECEKLAAPRKALLGAIEAA